MIALGGFIVRYWRFVLPIAGVCVLTGAYWSHGVIKYHEGYKDAERALKSKIEAVTIKEIKKAGKDKERIKHVEERMENNDIDLALDSLGIMRRDDDL